MPAKPEPVDPFDLPPVEFPAEPEDFARAVAEPEARPVPDPFDVPAPAFPLEPEDFNWVNETRKRNDFST